MDIVETIDKNPETNIYWRQLLDFAQVIKSKSVRDFTIEFLNTKVPDYFARIPASASGKYHPEYAQGYGGLARHTLAVATLANDIIKTKYLQFNQVDRDCIIAACLLHDTFKQGETECGTTVRTHPEIAAKNILSFAREKDMEDLGKIIAALVIAHMGEFGNHKPGSRGQFVLHLADFLASRKNITVSWDTILTEVTKE